MTDVPPRTREIAAGASVALAIVVSMALDVPTATFLLVLVALATAVARPFAALAILAVLMPLREPEVFQPIGLVRLLIGAIVAGCLMRAPFERHRPAVGPAAVLLGAYLLLSAVSIPIALSGGLASEQGTAANRFLQTAGIAVTFVIARYLLARTNPVPYLALAVASAAFAGSLGILQAVWGGPQSIPFRDILSARPDAEWFDRATGPFFDPNYYGFLLASALVAGTSLFRFMRRRWRLVFLLLGGVIGIALVLTFSRGAALAAIVGLLVLAFGRSRRLGLALGASAVLLVVVAYPLFIGARLERTFGDVSNRAFAAEEANLDLREGLLRTSVQMFLSEPVFGVGYGRFQFESSRFLGNSPETFAHSVYGQILAEQGLVGSVMAALIVAGAIASVLRVRGRFRAIGLAIVACYLVAGLFLELTISIQASGLAMLALAAAIAAPVRAPAPGVVSLAGPVADRSPALPRLLPEGA